MAKSTTGIRFLGLPHTLPNMLLTAHVTATTMAMAMSIALAVAFIFPLPSYGYIPSARTISQRVAKNHGRGVYAIEQEIEFKTLLEPLVLREKWVVANGDNMKVTITPTKTRQDQFRFEIVYKDGKRTAADGSGGIKSEKFRSEFAEPFFFVRTGKALLDSVIRAQIAPASLAKDRPAITSLKDLKYLPDPFVRLGRSSGVLTWIFGQPTSTDVGTLSPSIWIQQDAFDVRRIRFQSEAEVSADKYAVFSGSIKLPRERLYSWAGNLVSVKIITVKSVDAAQVAATLSPSSLSGSDVKTAKIPENELVKEFYQRFR